MIVTTRSSDRRPSHGACLQGGKTYFVPVYERENMGTINNFHRWETAFRVYCNIYSTAQPARATELFQYSHVIAQHRPLTHGRTSMLMTRSSDVTCQNFWQ